MTASDSDCGACQHDGGASTFVVALSIYPCMGCMDTLERCDWGSNQVLHEHTTTDATEYRGFSREVHQLEDAEITRC
jgi:hypothetical protein